MKIYADLYDAIEFVAEAYDGVGSNWYTSFGTDVAGGDPQCVIGLVLFAKDLPTFPSIYNDPDIKLLEGIVGDSGGKSDNVVNEYRRAHDTQRMPFNLWAPAVGLERADV